MKDKIKFKARTKKDGNSLSIIVPKHFREEVGMNEVGSEWLVTIESLETERKYSVYVIECNTPNHYYDYVGSTLRYKKIYGDKNVKGYVSM